MVPPTTVDESLSVTIDGGSELLRPVDDDGGGLLLVRSSPIRYSNSVVTNVLYFLLSVYFYLDLQGGMFFS